MMTRLEDKILPTRKRVPAPTPVEYEPLISTGVSIWFIFIGWLSSPAIILTMLYHIAFVRRKPTTTGK